MTVDMCASVCGSSRTSSCATFRHHMSWFSETGFLCGLELTHYAGLSGQQAPGVLRSLSPQH